MIHISTDTKLLLDTSGDFLVERRGVAELPAKGLVDTYWLLGRGGDSDSESDNYKVSPLYKVEVEPGYMK